MARRRTRDGPSVISEHLPPTAYRPLRRRAHGSTLQTRADDQRSQQRQLRNVVPLPDAPRRILVISPSPQARRLHEPMSYRPPQPRVVPTGGRAHIWPLQRTARAAGPIGAPPPARRAPPRSRSPRTGPRSQRATAARHGRERLRRPPRASAPSTYRSSRSPALCGNRSVQILPVHHNVFGRKAPCGHRGLHQAGGNQLTHYISCGAHRNQPCNGAPTVGDRELLPGFDQFQVRAQSILELTHTHGCDGRQCGLFHRRIVAL